MTRVVVNLSQVEILTHLGADGVACEIGWKGVWKGRSAVGCDGELMLLDAAGG